ncbi:MAG: phosphoribosylanthranilate isomerase [Xanthomonadales bacterium]|nr:phosphoribosylanthranilate isomerase [Xanthomonadales bacterium]NIN60426.1 phosphoribosylanthranilate isomerase [Xanthomonadales bacterium]NIN75779.1 phosphoribosylanthranilate isomerase [Xanthomonadales bacterium]NIO12957.1 phosphoribosylanthranilate isomerase [Xanthomonadales bacterium]NIP12819.1 phosphoribosylanthranilate isomerase [Xanthomonadales bacterium]
MSPSHIARSAPTRVKICCIASVDEARLAIDAGAWAVGLVAAMPSGPGPIADALITRIAGRVAGQVETVLLTSRVEAAGIIEHHRQCRTSSVQLVDRVPFGDLERVRRALPGVRLVQVVHVKDDESIDEALGVAPRVDAILLDSGVTAGPVRELGGTGRTHDWSISRRIRDSVGVPLILAGGLTPENVAGAIRAVRPWAVDLCSGIRAEGRLDAARLAAFMQAVHAA